MLGTPSCTDPTTYATGHYHLCAFAFSHLLPEEYMRSFDIALHCPHTVIAILHERSVSPAWSHWLQKWSSLFRIIHRHDF